MTSSTRNRFYVIRAWLVHLYTSLGILAGFFTLNAIINDDPKSVFIFMLISLVIDATDGTLARAWKVSYWTPGFDGRKLDDITDYLNYAFLPLVFAYKFGLVTGYWVIALFVAFIAAAYGFCQKAAKTNDGYFTGFPNFWNIVIFYLFLFRLPIEVNGLILLFCAAMIWVPVTYLSYSTPAFELITRVVSLVYGIVLVLILINFSNVDMRLVWLSLIFPLYYVVASCVQFFKRLGQNECQ